jgi:hypothetical protein
MFYFQGNSIYIECYNPDQVIIMDDLGYCRRVNGMVQEDWPGRANYVELNDSEETPLTTEEALGAMVQVLISLNERMGKGL